MQARARIWGLDRNAVEVRGGRTGAGACARVLTYVVMPVGVGRGRVNVRASSK